MAQLKYSMVTLNSTPMTNVLLAEDVFVFEFVTSEQFVGLLSFVGRLPKMNEDLLACYHEKKAVILRIATANVAVDSGARIESGCCSKELCFNASIELIIVVSRSCQKFLLLILVDIDRLLLDLGHMLSSCFPCQHLRFDSGLSVWL